MSEKMTDEEFEELSKSRKEEKQDYLNSTTKDVFDKSFFEDEVRENSSFIGRKSVLQNNKKSKKTGK